jgi:hypothetical protein
VNVLREGFRAAQRNVGALAVYMLIIAALSGAIVLGDSMVSEQVRESPFSGYTALRLVLAVVVGAAAQTLAFTWISQEIGRPLWKISTGEGFRIFLPLWLVLQGIAQGLNWGIGVVAATTHDLNLASSLLLLSLPLLVLLTPIGACFMQKGHVSLRGIREALRPLADLLPQTMVVLLFAAGVLFLVLALVARSPVWVQPLIAIIRVYFDAVIFASAWTLCAQHEHAFEGDDDLDF